MRVLLSLPCLLGLIAAVAWPQAGLADLDLNPFTRDEKRAQAEKARTAAHRAELEEAVRRELFTPADTLLLGQVAALVANAAGNPTQQRAITNADTCVRYEANTAIDANRYADEITAEIDEHVRNAALRRRGIALLRALGPVTWMYGHAVGGDIPAQVERMAAQDEAEAIALQAPLAANHRIRASSIARAKACMQTLRAAINPGSVSAVQSKGGGDTPPGPGGPPPAPTTTGADAHP